MVAWMNKIGMIYVETGESVGQAETEQAHASYTTSRSVSKPATIIFRLTAVMGLGPTTSTATDYGQCHEPKIDENNETFFHFAFGSGVDCFLQ